MGRCRLAAAILAAVLVGGVVACGSADGTAREDAEIPSVSGVVLEVTAKSLSQIDVLTIQDDTGVTREFHGGTYVGISPSHVREHMLQGLRLTVWYREENGLLVIHEVGDYVTDVTPAPPR